MKSIFIILLMFADLIVAQFSDFRRVSILDSNKSYYSSSFIIEEQGSLEKIFLFYTQQNPSGIFFTTNINRSNSWTEPKIVIANKNALSLSSLKLTTSKILLAYTISNGVEFTITSNSGLSWSQLPTITLVNPSRIKLLKLKDNQIGLIWSRTDFYANNFYILKSNNEGQSWGESQLLLSNCFSADLVLTESGEYLLFYIDQTMKSIKLKSSTDLINWSAEKEIINSQYNISEINITKDNSDKLYLTYVLDYPVMMTFLNSDILLMTSENRGNSWTEPLRWTTF